MTPTKQEVAYALSDADYLAQRTGLSAYEAELPILAAALRASEARAELAERQYREVWTGARTAFGAHDFDACLGAMIIRHGSERARHERERKELQG